MKKQIVQYVLNFAFLLFVFAITMVSVLQGENLKLTVEYILSADPVWVILGVICVLIFIIGESVIIRYLLKTLNVKVPFFHCCLYSFIGFFYSCITPSASGGQPMQVIAMRKDKIPAAVSTVVLVMVTIAYKLVLVIIGVLILLIQPATLMVYLDNVKGYMLLGLGLNVGCILLLFLVVFDPHLLKGLNEGALSLWNKIRPLRRPEKVRARVDRMIEQYRGSAEYFRSHQHVFFHVLLMTFVQRITLFLIAWLTYKAFYLSGHGILLITGLQAMISVAADMLPLPGGVGVSETLFLEIFEPIFREHLILPAMMISRGISYYTQLFISAVMTVLSAFVLRENKGKIR